MAISNYINTAGFTTQIADTRVTATSGYALATPVMITVSTVTGVQPATVLNLYSLFVQYGDGTELEITQVTDSIITSPPHTYNWPGEYEIKLIVIPKDGSASAIYSNTFTVWNYIVDNLSWVYTKWPDVGNNLSSGALFHGYQSCPPGFLNQATPLTFQFNISNVNLQNIVFNLYVDNSLSQPWEVATPNNKYAQLRPRWRFTDLEGNVVTSLTASNFSPVYINSSGNIQDSPLSGTLVGYTGFVDFYYIDDLPSMGYGTVAVPTIYVTYETNAVYNQQDVNDVNVPSYANSQVGLTTQFYVKTLSADHLGITIDGGTIPLPNVIWPDTDSTFFATVNSSYTSDPNFSNKVLLNYPLQGPGALYNNVNAIVTPTNAATVYNTSFKFNRYDYLNRDTGGYYKNIISTLPASSIVNFVTSVPGTLTTTLILSTANFSNIIEPVPTYYSLANRQAVLGAKSPSVFVSTAVISGSYTFNITDFEQTYFVRKINESFNYGENLQSYALQEFIANDTNLITFLSAIAGDNVHPTENFGTVAYEKIANFVSNNQDVYTSGVNQLYSLASMIDTKFDNYNFVLPPVLQRQFDLYSTPHERLWGTREKWNTNFDATSGHTNLGDQLTAYNVFTTTVTAGNLIVINDVFNTSFYELLEVPVIKSYNAVVEIYAAKGIPLDPYFTNSLSYPLTTYPLSAFCGWGLKLPVATYYKFYVFNPVYSNTPVNNLIDWNQYTDGSLYTTLNESVSSLSAWYADSGILENIYTYYITEGLNLMPSKYYNPT